MLYYRADSRRKVAHCTYKSHQVQLIPISDAMSEEIRKFGLESLGSEEVLQVPKSMLFGALGGTRAARKTNKFAWYSKWAA